MPDTTRVTDLERENARLKADLASVHQQLEWLKRQLFGAKSEKRLSIDPAVQGNLLEGLGVAAPSAKSPPTETVTYQRRKKQRDAAVNDTGLRFGEEVPREIIAVSSSSVSDRPLTTTAPWASS